MERENDVSRSTGVLIPVSENSDVFKKSILAPLQSAYLFEESKQSFRYKSGFLIKNPAQEEKYNAYRAKRRDLGYSEEELKETYGFLLFDELGKANAIGETGVLIRNGTCSTLGDPSKGVYLSMYSDCLDLNRWYHGKSGYIAIIRVTQGRVKKVLENYTQSFTTPTVGFDCHVSAELHTVSSKTSSFLAFERTQYYMYELLDSGSNTTAEAPSLVCPFAVVAFSYTDTKATTETTEKKSEEKTVAFPYLAWTGQLQLGTQFYSVGLRSTAGSLVRAKLPPVVKVERAIAMLDLRRLLPRAAFETSFSGEAFLDSLFCGLCELTVSAVEEKDSFSQLLQEIRDKDLAFTVPLDDCGFLILLHSSNFLMYENDAGSNSKNVLQGMFVFPDSQVTQRDTKFEQKKLAIPSDIQWALPLLTYAEGEVQKTLLNPSEERNKIIVQHMQSYAALINPVLAMSPFREVSIFPDQYDVPDDHRHLYASPEWTDQSWPSFKSYLSKPVSFQVPILTASEILAAGQENRREDLDDDVYICLSSPEEAPANFINAASEEQVDQKCSPDTETSPAYAKFPEPDATTFLAEVETSLAVFKTSLAEVETSLAEVETSLAEVESSLPEVESPLPQVESSLPEVESPLPEVESSLGVGDTSIADAETSPTVAMSSLESFTTDMEKQLVVTAVPQNTVPDDFHDGEGITNSTETEKSGLRNVPSISDDLPAELIVSITSAAQTVSEEDLTVISTAPTKLNDSQLSVSSTEKLQMMGLNSLSDEVVKTKQTLECAEAKNPTKPHWGKQCKGHPRVLKKGSKHCTDTPRLLSPKVVPLKDDTGDVRRAKRKFGKLPSKREAGEEKQQDSPKDMLENTILKELETYSLRKKTERWDLKPVISECGNILVPHGSLDFTDELKSLKGKLLSLTVEQCPEKMLVDATVHAGSMGEMQKVSSDVSETPQSKTKAVQENLLDTFSSMKCASKAETMLTKLKSVLFRSKRKGDHVRSEKPKTETASDSGLCPKRARIDLDADMLKSSNAVTCVQETNVCVQEVSKMLSVDLVFAQALGLTPKETPDKLQKVVGHNVQQRKDSPETHEQSIAHKQPRILLRPPSIFPRRSRIKMLKKHQSVPAEHIRSKCTPFQVSPLSGSTRLLLHPQQYGDGTQTLQPSVDRKEKVELKQRTPGWLKKCTRRRKFRHSRTFVNRYKSVQVTRQWEENYDFNLDSRFTVNSLDKTVNRALHGPWDLSMYDTTEEVQLIIHMLIGLFYSRSTDRFFNLDPNFTFSPLDDSDGLEMSSGKMSDAFHSEPVSDGLVPSTTDTSDSQALDLSKNSNSVLDQGSVLLDLSLRTTDAEVATLDPKVSNKQIPGTDEQEGLCETQNALKPFLGLHAASPFQCYRNMVHSKGIVHKVNDSRSIHAKQRTCVPSQKDGCLKHTDTPSSENDKISVGGGEENVSIQLRSVPPALEINNMLHGSCNERTGFKDGMENSDTIQMCLVHKPELDLTHDEVKSNTDPTIELQSVVHYKNVSKDGENFEGKDDTHHRVTVEDLSAVICTDDNSPNKKSDAVGNEHVSENETKHLLKAQSPCQTENAVEDEDCTAHKSRVIGDGNRFGKEEKCKEDMETGFDLSDQPISITCDGPDSVKDDCITELDCQAPVTEEQSQANSRRSAMEDLPLKMPCANDNVLLDEHAVSENAFINKEHVNGETATETSSENYVCLSDKATYLEKNSTTCLDVFKAGEPSTQMDNLEPGIQAELIANLNMRNEEDITSVTEEQKVDNTPQEPFDHQALVFQDEVVKPMETEVAMTDEIYVKYDGESKGLWNTHDRVIIPFIGADTSFDGIMESQFSDPKWKVQGKEATPLISTTTGTGGILLTEVNSATHVDSEHAELFCGKMPLSVSDAKERVVCKESGSDDRCPTPTIDETPYRYACSDPTGALNSEIRRDITLKDHSRSSTPVLDETSLENKSILNDSSCDGVKSDLELRILRLQQSVNEFLSTLPHTNESIRNQTADTQHSLEQTPSSSIKCKPTHSSPNKQLRTVGTNDTKDKPNTKSKSDVGHEPCSISHRPVMAVKPSKSDESQRGFIPEDGSSEKSTSSKNAETKIADVKVSTPRSLLSPRKTSFKPDGQNVDHQDTSKLFFKDSSTSTDRRLNLNKGTFLHCDSFHEHQHMDSSTFVSPTSSFSVQSLNLTNSASKHVDGHQHLRNFGKKVGTTKCNLGEDPDDYLQATSFVDYKTNKVTGDTLIPGIQTSLACTVHNDTNRKSSYSFLEQVSNRCLQEDPTQASMDQECLIFSEQMKQLLKRQIPHHQIPIDKSECPCTGPMTVHFSSLDEKDDSCEDFEVLPSLVGQKIKVDMSDRNQLSDGTEEKRTLQPQKSSCDARNPKDQVGVSAMTEECTRLYKDMMNDVCSGLKVSSTTKNSQMDGVYPKSDPDNYFDFCSQMKRELDESFRSHLNSVVKKSCRTKYRFFMLVTSDNAFFEETKVHLEAEGHSAVHPSTFFLDEDSPSLLVIIRNEDIAEHICEVPHLLELKMSKGVRFVGIDEPDDIMNLTHQELFNRGGFVMFDGAALDTLSLCNLKKLADVLEKLCQTGKWKWFMHYRESRRLKENARFCTEAKERKHFLNKCQEDGMLELLPYHECDLMSRQQPDYLTCLCHLQVQNISARYPVFVTDTTTDKTFGRSGILTMTVNSFLMNSVNTLT